MPLKFPPQARAQPNCNPRSGCTLTLVCALLIAARSAFAAGIDPEKGFVHPPDSARPWVHWFWLDGNISREGITADLEAMQRVGIGGAVLMDITQDMADGPVRFGTPLWQEMFGHAVAEARRVGVKLSMHNAPGWCGSGGPWVTPELAMQRVVFTKTNLNGPAQFDGVLPAPPAFAGYLGEIATVAFPTLVGDGATVPGFAPTLSASHADSFDGAKLIDRNPKTFVRLPLLRSGKEQFIEIRFKEPFIANQLELTGTTQKQTFQGTLQVSTNGRTFTHVRDFLNRGASVSFNFPAVTGRAFRVVFTQAEAASKQLQFSELDLFPVFRIETAGAKAGMGRVNPTNPPAGTVPAYGLIDPKAVIDLARQVDAAGRLSWNVPKGEWTVMRFAHTPIGRTNHPTIEGLGLECDKLSKAAIEWHFQSFLGKLIQNAGKDAGISFAAGHIDSWEHGYQNWTPTFLKEFQARRGYDLVPYLPTYSGRIVGSLETSERVLWDVRRTVAEVWADNYAGRLAELLHQHGMELSIEAYANGPFDYLTYAGRADVPMGEFWAENTGFGRFTTSKYMASAAHTYGKQVVAAESFTSYPEAAKWKNHPFTLKPLADAEFTEGVNRIVFHRYAHQPWLNRRPGMTMGRWGIHYERTETWWEQSGAWHDYLARCQFLLQSGRFVADLCYVTGETAYVEPPSRDKLQPPLPEGYDYDVAPPEVILNRIQVKDGRLVLPDGMSYRVLVMPPTPFVTPKLLRKIKELVQAGATIVGPRPLRSPSLSDYPACDAEVKNLADELWGDLDGKTKLERRAGKGVVVWGKPLGAVLAQSGVSRDFEQLTPIRGCPLLRIHREIEGNDFYFVCNSNLFPVSVECSFRVTGKQPELWRPDTGQITPLAGWRVEKGRTIVPLDFDTAGSVFVVFRKPHAGFEPAVALIHNGKPFPMSSLIMSESGRFRLSTTEPGEYQAKTQSGKSLRAETSNLPGALDLKGPWTVAFPSNSGAPPLVSLPQLISWSEHDSPGVRYFSGTAVYTNIIRLDASMLQEDLRWYIDLGRAEVIAELSINGKDFGALWKPPFRIDVTESLKAGENALAIKVINLWPNRLIGDEQLPDDCRWRPVDNGSAGATVVEWPKWFLEGKPSPTGRITFTAWKHWTKASELLPSGLLGPVKLIPEGRISFGAAQ